MLCWFTVHGELGDCHTEPENSTFTLCQQQPRRRSYKFTGKERDSESGLDNFGARFFTSSLGRFMTPDWAARPTAVPYAMFGDPQSLNLYSYARNDAVSRADADGHISQEALCPTGSTCSPFDDPTKQKPSSPKPKPAQNQHHHHKAKPKSPYQPKNKMANVLFNETGTIQGDASSIHEMRVATGHVYMNVKHKSAFQGQSSLDAPDQNALKRGIGVTPYNDSVSAAAEARSDPSDPTNGSTHFFIRDTTPGRNQEVPDWASGDQMVFGPYTAGANNLLGGADTHKGDTIEVWINTE